jgi:hypothetical protein
MPFLKLQIENTNMRYRYQEGIRESGVFIQLIKFNEIKLTPKGAWVIQNHCFKKRFVLNGTGKRFCHETKEMAWFAFKMRKISHVKHLINSLNLAKHALDTVTDIDKPYEDTTNIGQPEFFKQFIFD